MRKDNRGLSLVELMAVIAILAVVGAVAGFGINAMLGRPAQQCSQQLVYSLEKHRMSAMGKVESQYVLKVDATTDKIVAEEYLSNTAGSLGTPVVGEVGSSGIEISYQCGTNVYDLETDGPLTLKFERGSGAFKPQADGTYCTKIFIKRGGREHQVTLVPLTGKVYID